jgi:hypothetical protein
MRAGNGPLLAGSGLSMSILILILIYDNNNKKFLAIHESASLATDQRQARRTRAVGFGTSDGAAAIPNRHGEDQILDHWSNI